MANLPADLPEDWTQGQIVSPNGTEVGLTEQHGYNYLMEQVNATQTEVNAINTALEDVAQETSVQQVITTIGTTTDSGGSSTEGSLMSKLNEILGQLGISTTGSTVQEVLEELLTQPNIIKNIQQGLISSSKGNPTNIELAGFTNINKTVYLINGFTATASPYNLYVSNFTINNLAINTYDPSAKRGDYQVIEFF